MMSMSRDDCRGSRVGCFREHAGRTPAATELLRREGGHPPSPRLRRGYQSNPLLLGKRINDFFEARIATQRVPERHQFQLAISEVKTTGATDCGGKLFAGEIFLTNPGSNH